MRNFIVLSILLTLNRSVLLIMLLKNEDVCDRRPLGTKTQPLPPDNRFAVEIIGIANEYIPNREYSVRLYARDNVSTFIAFTISAREDEKWNEKNPRRPVHLDTGMILPSQQNDDGIRSPRCNNTVIQANITPKTQVWATWIAPPKDNKCVTIFALVAMKADVWYNNDGPLSKTVCEDLRKDEDMPPSLNGNNCNVCEEARYQLIFEGLWSYNTHPYMYPVSQELARFSDLVGACHGNGFQLYQLNKEAGEGIKMLAEQGNTTTLEYEIQKELGPKVRTIIKATGQPRPSMSTSAIFRASPEHHRVSLVTAIIPSPDWFLGVADLELCPTGVWSENIKLNLYPMDAGTDSGRTFESPNEGTMPPQPISQAAINRNVSDEQKRPFAKLHLQLISTYIKPFCTATKFINVVATGAGEGDTNTDVNESNNAEGNDYNYQPPVASSTEEPIVIDPNSDPDCPVKWEEWLECEGICEEGRLKGFKTRLGYLVIDGVEVGKYTKYGSHNDKEIPEKCLGISLSETTECEEECSETTTTPGPVAPGDKW